MSSLARSLVLPESEVPWVFVLDPSGRVVASAHALFNRTDLTRLVAAIPRADDPRDAGDPPGALRCATGR